MSGEEFDKQVEGDGQHIPALPCVSHLLPCPAPTGGYICVSAVVPQIHLFSLLSDFFLYRVWLFFFPFLSVFEFLELRTTWACVCVSSLSGLISRGGNSAKCCAKRLLSNLLSRVHTMFPIFFMRKVKLRQVNGTPPKVR